jgi:hypothetical protein
MTIAFAAKVFDQVVETIKKEPEAELILAFRFFYKGIFRKPFSCRDEHYASYNEFKM